MLIERGYRYLGKYNVPKNSHYCYKNRLHTFSLHSLKFLTTLHVRPSLVKMSTIKHKED